MPCTEREKPCAYLQKWSRCLCECCLVLQRSYIPVTLARSTNVYNHQLHSQKKSSLKTVSEITGIHTDNITKKFEHKLLSTGHQHWNIYVEINQQNSLNYILLYFSFTMAPTCFGKTMPSSGSDYVPF
jgi:hypothetical protein